MCRSGSKPVTVAPVSVDVDLDPTTKNDERDDVSKTEMEKQQTFENGGFEKDVQSEDETTKV